MFYTSFVYVSESVGRTFRGLFKGNLYNLEQKIDTDYGLLAKLVDYEVIRRAHRANIEVMFAILDCNL